MIEKIEAKGPHVLVESMLSRVISHFTKSTNKNLLNKLEQMFEEFEPKALI
jgi:hypothetical protein